MTAKLDQPEKKFNTCRGCKATWTGTAVCHCTGCHQTFAGVTAFDNHRDHSASMGEHGGCRRPAEMLTKDGERTLWLRDGVWRAPEMTEAQKTARWG